MKKTKISLKLNIPERQMDTFLAVAEKIEKAMQTKRGKRGIAAFREFSVAHPEKAAVIRSKTKWLDAVMRMAGE